MKATFEGIFAPRENKLFFIEVVPFEEGIVRKGSKPFFYWTRFPLKGNAKSLKCMCFLFKYIHSSKYCSNVTFIESRNVRKRTFIHARTTQTQIRLHIRAV